MHCFSLSVRAQYRWLNHGWRRVRHCSNGTAQLTKLLRYRWIGSIRSYSTLSQCLFTLFDFVLCLSTTNTTCRHNPSENKSWECVRASHGLSSKIWILHVPNWDVMTKWLSWKTAATKCINVHESDMVHGKIPELNVPRRTRGAVRQWSWPIRWNWTCDITSPLKEKRGVADLPRLVEVLCVPLDTPTSTTTLPSNRRIQNQVDAFQSWNRWHNCWIFHNCSFNSTCIKGFSSIHQFKPPYT